MAHVGHSEIKAFAAERVNLPPDRAARHRAQVTALRERLQAKIDADPDYGLVKMLHAGSVAKGTALSQVHDLDAAVYVKVAAAPTGTDGQLVHWLAKRLMEANTNMGADQFVENPHCVTVSFKGTGLDVDVVPVLYEGEPDDRGYLVRKNTGDRKLTSITLHLRFIRGRKTTYGAAFAELIRLTKWWRRTVDIADPNGFRFKSFMVELLWAHLADRGVVLTDYPTALREFFRYVVTTNLGDQVMFTDFVTAKPPPRSAAAIEVLDPVNLENNVAELYSASDRDRIVDAAHAAFSAINEAQRTPTKGQAVECWQTVFGPTFSP